MVCQNPRAFRAALLISCGLCLAACALPATDQWKIPDGYRTDDPLKGEHYETVPGIGCLLFGWIGVFSFLEYPANWDYSSGFGWAAWLANPLALAGAVLLIFRRPTGAAAFCFLSVVVGMLFVIDPPRVRGHSDIPRVGAVLWLGSLVVLTIAAMIRRGGSKVEKRD